MMNTFFEEVARYPEGEVRYTLPGGGSGVAATTGKTKWYEWVGYAGLAAAAVGLAFVSAGATVPATVCFAAGALAGGVSAAGHLGDTLHLGTATTATVVLDVAQIVASFASAGAMNITLKAGGAAAALASSRWFLPLVGSAASADVVQLVALTDITFVELSKIQSGAGTPEDKQRAMAVIFTQLVVTSGMTALSVQGARSARALAGQSLEIVEQNGVKVLRVTGEETSVPATHSDSLPKNTEHGAAAPDGHEMAPYRQSSDKTAPNADGAAKNSQHDVPKPSGHQEVSVATVEASATGGTDLRAPARRHWAATVNQGTVAKNVNTVIVPGVDVATDVAGIRAGKAARVDGNYVINGRMYGSHDGTLYPISGPGFHQLNRGAFQALGVLNKFGDTPQAHGILEKMKNVGPSEVEAALAAWSASR
jgi:hypothetical protein